MVSVCVCNWPYNSKVCDEAYFGIVSWVPRIQGWLMGADRRSLKCGFKRVFFHMSFALNIREDFHFDYCSIELKPQDRKGFVQRICRK